MSPSINRVWIEEGCILCKVCEDLAPKVFLVDGDETCVIRPEAAAHFEAMRDDIEEAALDCPVEVIQIEHDERADDDAAPDAGARTANDKARG